MENGNGPILVAHIVPPETYSALILMHVFGHLPELDTADGHDVSHVDIFSFLFRPPYQVILFAHGVLLPSASNLAHVKRADELDRSFVDGVRLLHDQPALSEIAGYLVWLPIIILDAAHSAAVAFLMQHRGPLDASVDLDRHASLALRARASSSWAAAVDWNTF